MKLHRHQFLLFISLWLILIQITFAEHDTLHEEVTKGRVPFEFSWSIEAKVEVNLTPKLINLAAKSIGNVVEIPELIQMLEGIYMRTYDTEVIDERELVSYFRWKLKEDTWETLVKITEDNETFEINLLFDEDTVYGIFVIVISEMSQEVTFINIVGKIAPERVEDLLLNLGDFGVRDIDVRRKLRRQAVFAQKTGQKELLAVKINAPPIIDGVLDDACWKIAPQTDNFTRSYYETPVEDDSIVKLVYTPKAIYVGWYLYDSRPDKIVARQTREPRMWGITEDWVSFEIDQFYPYRRTWFMANPFGITRVLMPGRYVDQLDRGRMGQWNAAAKIVADGWIVEMEIPWQILDYPETTEPIQIGINFQRSHARPRIASFWSNMGYPMRSEDDGSWLHVLPPPKSVNLLEEDKQNR